MNKNKKIIGIIPARFKSSRFEGKPLADIFGKPMVWWVWNQAKKVKLFNKIIIATEDQRIFSACTNLGINVQMTSSNHLTGTDRIGEIAKSIKADIYVNIQGDEPLIEPETIENAILPLIDDENLKITNLMTKIVDPIEVINFTIPKVIVNSQNIGLYLTRSPSPYPKGSLSFDYYKQVCVYGFRPDALEFFSNSPRGKIEIIEDIEILRFIEAGYKVKFIEVKSNSIAVDTPNDLQKVKDYIIKNNKNNY
jgi:3-deoxy-manno-octulosonate cytidylyltransferase (CMP-KDO synthetase)